MFIRDNNPFTFGDNEKSLAVRRREWTPDSFLNLAKTGKGEDFLGKSIDDKILGKIFLVIALFLFLLFSRAFYLQIIRGGEYRDFAEGNRIRIKVTPPPRGLIYDRGGEAFVKNVGSFNLVVVPSDLPKKEEDKEALFDNFSEEYGIAKEQIKSLLEGVPSFSYQPILLKENISREEALKILIQSENLPGFSVDVGIRREYIINGEESSKNSLAHIIGYEGKITRDELALYGDDYYLNDRLGKSGLELSYENLLRGQHGEKKVEVDVRGREIKVLAEVKPEFGRNIKLSIDKELQKKTEELLARYLKSNNKKRGAVIIEDPNSGEILSMVSLPTFNNNDFSEGISQEIYTGLINDESQPLFNRAIKGEYPSGSIFKPIVALAALEEGIINQRTSFLSVGGINVYQWFFPDWKAGGHGWTNVTRALAESINTFFYIIGGGYKDFEGLGIYKIVEYAKKFNLGEGLGVDLPGEAFGFLPTPEWKEKAKGEEWYIGDTYHLAIGQGDILVTPLQAVSWISVFANGGTLYRPYLVKEILNEKNEVVEEVKPEIINSNFAFPQNIDIIRSGLRQAVVSGSAKGLLDLPITSAGKTGTAQWHSKKQPHSWFVGFAPYNNPKVAIVVLIEEGGEGSGVALAVAHDILGWYFGNKEKEL
ncbi:MAG: penicillin-binding protein 2 [Patescibacteria group bacterium]|nr:penicillin-binding protein 2 [Patescibacteria group bacterium]MDD5490453.1 penicillin-binding protein 2 [Patescibacteria group bacterium]